MHTGRKLQEGLCQTAQDSDVWSNNSQLVLGTLTAGLFFSNGTCGLQIGEIWAFLVHLLLVFILHVYPNLIKPSVLHAFFFLVYVLLFCFWYIFTYTFVFIKLKQYCFSALFFLFFFSLSLYWGMVALECCGWRGRWGGGLGWGIHVYPWLIHVNVWQKQLQYCKVISLQLIKKKNVVLVLAVHLCESAICTLIFPPSWAYLPPSPLTSTPLGHHRKPRWAPCAI